MIGLKTPVLSLPLIEQSVRWFSELRRDGGQTQVGNHRNVVVQVEAGRTDPPAVSIAAATERPPDTICKQVKRPAPMNISGAFCERSEITKIT